MRIFKSLSNKELKQAIETSRAVIDPCTSETMFLENLEQEFELREIEHRMNNLIEIDFMRQRDAA